MRELIPAASQQWAKSTIGRLSRAMPGAPVERRRALLIHVDGVSKSVLDEAIARGTTPFIGQLLRSNAYSVDRAFWGAPPSTPVFEGSLLYGVRHPDIPAYCWFDRADRSVKKMNVPEHARAVQAELRRKGSPLLGEDGTSYLTLFQGAEGNALCMAALTDPKAALRSLRESLSPLLASVRRSAFANLARVVREISHAVFDGVRGGFPQGDWRHEPELALVRLFVLGALAGVARARTIADMVRGVPVVYLVEAGFDEVSHRRGPDSKQARRELARIDAAVANLYAIAKSLPQPYDVYLFSDHGQSSTTPYEALAGRTLADALSLKGSVAPPLGEDTTRALFQHGAQVAGSVGEGEVVLQVGAAAHVYFGSNSRPLVATEVLAQHRDVLGKLVEDPRVGLVALRRPDGAVGIANGKVFTADAIPPDALPSAYSARAVAELLSELPKMPNAGDLVAFGAGAGDGVVGFSWESGTHGGLTSRETDSFVMWPSDAPTSLDSLDHAVKLHARLTGAYS